MGEEGRLRELESLEVCAVAAAAPQELVRAAGEELLATRRGQTIFQGEVFSSAGREFAVVACAPVRRGLAAQHTDLRTGSAFVPHLERVQLTCFDCEPEAEDSLFDEFIKPWMQSLQRERQRDGGQYLQVLTQDLAVRTPGCEFVVRALDPSGRHGALDNQTAVFVAYEDLPALGKVHVLPYEDTLPDAYDYDLFRDFLQPFFQAHPLAIYGEGDHLTYRGIRFRIMATDPPRTASRVDSRTTVFCDGESLRPTMLDVLPQELREDLQRLPQGLQMLLLNTMANEEAVRGRLAEVHEVLRPGQGLESQEISSCGRRVVWHAAGRESDTQQQCMVCLGEFAEGEDLRELDCEHLFHQECIDEWLRRSAACPICKRPMSSGGGGGGAGSQSASLSSSARLLSNARVTHRSRLGTVKGFDASSKRLRVALDGAQPGAEELLPAEEVVQRVSGVRLAGLRTAELNGRSGEIMGLDQDAGRYLVALSGAEARTLGVKADHCILPDGVVARVVDLRSGGHGARWNGHYGRVVGYDTPRQRHLLAMAPRGQLLSVKPKNLRV